MEAIDPFVFELSKEGIFWRDLHNQEEFVRKDSIRFDRIEDPGNVIFPEISVIPRAYCEKGNILYFGKRVQKSLSTGGSEAGPKYLAKIAP